MQESQNVATYYNYFLQNTRYKSYITKNNFSTNAFVIHKMLPTNNKLGIVAITTKLKKKKHITIKEKGDLSTDETTESKSGETTGVHALIIQMTNIDLNRSVIL